MDTKNEFVEQIEKLLSLSKDQRRNESQKIAELLKELIKLNHENSTQVEDILFTVFSKHRGDQNFLDAFIEEFLENCCGCVSVEINGEAVWASKLYPHIKKCLVSGETNADWAAEKLKTLLLTRDFNKKINTFVRECIEYFVTEDEQSAVLEKVFDFLRGNGFDNTKWLKTNLSDGRQARISENDFFKTLFEDWIKQWGKEENPIDGKFLFLFIQSNAAGKHTPPKFLDDFNYYFFKPSNLSEYFSKTLRKDPALDCSYFLDNHEDLLTVSLERVLELKNKDDLKNVWLSLLNNKSLETFRSALLELLVKASVITVADVFLALLKDKENHEFAISQYQAFLESEKLSVAMCVLSKNFCACLALEEPTSEAFELLRALPQADAIFFQKMLMGLLQYKEGDKEFVIQKIYDAFLEENQENRFLTQLKEFLSSFEYGVVDEKLQNHFFEVCPLPLLRLFAASYASNLEDWYLANRFLEQLYRHYGEESSFKAFDDNVKKIISLLLKNESGSDLTDSMVEILRSPSLLEASFVLELSFYNKGLEEQALNWVTSALRDFSETPSRKIAFLLINRNKEVKQKLFDWLKNNYSNYPLAIGSMLVTFVQNEPTKDQTFQMIESVLDGKDEKVKQHAYLALTQLWDKEEKVRDCIQKILTANWSGCAGLKWSRNEKLKDSYSLALFCVMESNDEAAKNAVLGRLIAYLLSENKNEKTLVASVLKRLMNDQTFSNKDLQNFLVALAEKDQNTISNSFKEAFDAKHHASMLVEMLLHKDQANIALACLSGLSDENKQAVATVMAERVVPENHKGLHEIVQFHAQGVQPKVWLAAATVHAYGQEKNGLVAARFVFEFLSHCSLKELVEWMEIEGLDTDAEGFSKKISELGLKEKDKLEIAKHCTNIFLDKKAVGGNRITSRWHPPSFDLNNEKQSLAKNLEKIVKQRLESEKNKGLGLV